MALQTSGPISFANLQTEFGGTHPITMGEYAEYRVSGSGDTISMDQFYGAFYGYILTQGISGTARGFNEAIGMGSIIPSTYDGANILQALLVQVLSECTMHFQLSGSLDKNFFTTFTGGGFTLASSVASHSQGVDITTWTWAVGASPREWTGSGDLDITIT